MQGKKSSPSAGARAAGGKKAAEKAQDKKLAALEEELQRAKEQALRALAEAENTRKRADKAQAEAHKYGAAALATAILSVADNLRRALDACASTSSSPDASLPSLLEGVRATERELQEVFRRHHIHAIDPKGEMFDPNFHEALFEVESSAHAPGTVLEVAACGYRLADRLLRPARVGVAKAPSSPAPSPPSAAEPKES